MNINLQSAFHLSQLAHPLLIASGAGRIAFEPSICRVVSVNTGYPIYSAAKGAQFSRKNLCVQLEVALNVVTCYDDKKKKSQQEELINSQGTCNANGLKTI